MAPYWKHANSGFRNTDTTILRLLVITVISLSVITNGQPVEDTTESPEEETSQSTEEPSSAGTTYALAPELPRHAVMIAPQPMVFLVPMPVYQPVPWFFPQHPLFPPRISIQEVHHFYHHIRQPNPQQQWRGHQNPQYSYNGHYDQNRRYQHSRIWTPSPKTTAMPIAKPSTTPEPQISTKTAAES